MSIKSASYGAAGMGLCGAAIIPGGLGAGFVAIGTKLLAVSGWLSDKGNHYKLYSQGLAALEKGDIKADDVNKLVSEKKMSYSDAVISLLSGVANVTVTADNNEKAVTETTAVVTTDTGTACNSDPACNSSTAKPTVGYRLSDAIADGAIEWDPDEEPPCRSSVVVDEDDKKGKNPDALVLAAAIC